MGDEERDKILRRRAYFVRAALASAGISVVVASCKDDSKPQVCLTPVREPAPKPCLKVAAPQDAGDAAPGHADASIDAGTSKDASNEASSATPSNSPLPRDNKVLPPRPPPQPCLEPPRPRPCLKMKPPSGNGNPF